MVGGFLTLLGCGLLTWLTYRTLKGHPELLSKENLSKSFTLMGILALALIAVIGLAVLLLKQ